MSMFQEDHRNTPGGVCAARYEYSTADGGVDGIYSVWYVPLQRPKAILFPYYYDVITVRVEREVPGAGAETGLIIIDYL